MEPSQPQRVRPLRAAPMRDTPNRLRRARPGTNKRSKTVRAETGTPRASERQTTRCVQLATRRPLTPCRPAMTPNRGTKTGRTLARLTKQLSDRRRRRASTRVEHAIMLVAHETAALCAGSPERLVRAPHGRRILISLGESLRGTNCGRPR